MVEETNVGAHATLSNAFPSSDECGVDPPFPAGVGSSGTKPPGGATYFRKRQFDALATQVIYIIMSEGNRSQRRIRSVLLLI